MLASTSLREECVEGVILQADTTLKNESEQTRWLRQYQGWAPNRIPTTLQAQPVATPLTSSKEEQVTHSTADGLVLGHLPVGLDAMLQAVKLPAGVSHLRNTVNKSITSYKTSADTVQPQK